MKKFALPAIIKVVILSLLWFQSFAQLDMKTDKPETQPDSESVTAVQKAILYKVNLKALRHFVLDYHSAATAEWSILQDKSYMCKFTNAKGVSRVYYNPNGSWSHTVSAYDGKQLEHSLYQKVWQAYYEYRIMFVTQIDLPRSRTIYLVQLQDEKTLKIVRVENDEMETIEEYEK
jgi:hypothetical protein